MLSLHTTHSYNTRLSVKKHKAYDRNLAVFRALKIPELLAQNISAFILNISITNDNRLSFDCDPSYRAVVLDMVRLAGTEMGNNL